ncbi:MAG: ammonium transporter [Candidatus Margulisbacteria bacterium]|nr:ammonium transporter [Candidatus Margulisiibacteriota bacterium]
MDLVSLIKGVNTIWVLITAFLVFFMQAGFGMLEAGLTRAKNASNILMKNFLDFCMASIGFFAVGYGLMYGAGNLFMGFSNFFMLGVAAETSGLPTLAFWLFQVVFCGAAATIVAGAMAERMKFPAYLVYSFFISVLVYPIVGHWIWGGGWLAQLGFLDFAGSTVVHALGGVASLVGTMMLGARIGKFNKNGSANAILGHNIPLACLGVFILWFGWFGFNPGSTLGIVDAGNLIARVAVNTNLAAAVGGLMAMLIVWLLTGKPELTMTMNGALAGLVAITAPCAFVSPISALIIGAIAGGLVVFGVFALDRIGVDDPVGAIPVHGLNGIWGTLSIGLFHEKLGYFFSGNFTQLSIQTIGILATIAWVVTTMFIIFKAIDLTIGLRVSREEELRGLDIGEHGMEAYKGFQIFVTE